MNQLNITYECLAKQAQLQPQKTALIMVNDDLSVKEEWTYQQLYQAVAQLTTGLTSLNLSPQARVLIRSLKNTDFIILFFAAIAASLVPIAGLSSLSGDEEQFILDNAEPELFYQQPDIALDLKIPAGCQELNHAELQQLMQAEFKPLTVKTDAEDPAFMLYTSGSTAKPKGVVHAQRAVLGREPMRQHWLDLQADDIVLHTGKPCWTYSMGVGFFDTWYKGGTALVYLGEERPDVWLKLVEKFKVSIFASSPVYYRAIDKLPLVAKEQLSSIRVAVSAGEKLSDKINQRWQDHYGITIYEALGMSEMSTFISFGPDIPLKTGSVGKVQPGRNVAILPIDEGTSAVATGETGILAVHKDNSGFMLVYYKREQEQQRQMRGDWFLTGDLMSADADGYLYYHGRYDDVLNIAGGHRVSPLEIEVVLRQHPLVDNAICHLGRHGEIENYLQADILLSDENAATEQLAHELHQHCVANLSDNKVPRLIRFIGEVPRKATGKINRKAIAEAKSLSPIYEFI